MLRSHPGQVTQAYQAGRPAEHPSALHCSSKIRDGWVDGWMDGGTDGWMDGWMDEQMDGWMVEGRLDRWMSRVPQHRLASCSAASHLLQSGGFCKCLAYFLPTMALSHSLFSVPWETTKSQVTSCKKWSYWAYTQRKP